MCVALSSVGGTGTYAGWQRPWSQNTSSGLTKPQKRGGGLDMGGPRGPDRCWRGHSQAHGPVEKAWTHASGPERFGESCPLPCLLGRDRQATLCLSVCFLDNSTSCVLPVRQETASACETKGSRPCHLLTRELLISWDDRRWQGQGTTLGVWRGKPSVRLDSRSTRAGSESRPLSLQGFPGHSGVGSASRSPSRPPPPVTACSCAFPSRRFLLQGKRERLCGFCSGGFV